MNIIAWLKKLGVIQSGTSSYKGTAQDRPVDFMNDEDSLRQPPQTQEDSTPEA